MKRMLLVVLLSSAVFAEDRDPAWAVAVKCECLKNCFKVSDTLYRCAQPDDEGMKEAKKLGIKTVINLRTFNNDKKEIAKSGLKSEEISVLAWDIDDDEVIKVMKKLADPAGAPYLVHCQHGADRTGVMVAMYRIIYQGWTKEKAIDELKRGGYGFHSIWKNIPKYIEKADIKALKAKINEKK